VRRGGRGERRVIDMGKITGLSVDREGLKKKTHAQAAIPISFLSLQNGSTTPTPEKINATPKKSTPIARVAWVV
jgi:hypothetical protein